ncbi:MAG: helix-turn-helix domain-containing protein, partial [Candidatus Latescibacteria bacterium]|nr:helix-turn-helix domain-containing protein [Candidatus Latescibacterota bacterium]
DSGSERMLRVPEDDLPLTETLEDLEKQLIERAFEKARGVKTKAAQILGIKTSALYYKLEKYDMI